MEVRLPAEVGKGAVGLSHAVDILLFGYCFALTLSG